MLTFSLSSEIGNVIGLISPCHSPSQNPAAAVLVCATSFGPAAQDASTRTAAGTRAASTSRRLVIVHLRHQPRDSWCLAGTPRAAGSERSPVRGPPARPGG